MAEIDTSTWTLAVCKSRQTVLRSRITSCHTRICKIVDKSLSRRDVEKHLADARVYLGDLDSVHDWILELHDKDVDLVNSQTQDHQRYAGKVDATSALVERYLETKEKQPL